MEELDDDLFTRYGLKPPPKPDVQSGGGDTRAESLRRAAGKLGVDAADLGSIISFETSGSFNPHKVGGENNKYKGLIQFGPDEQKRYYNPKDTFETQVEDGVVRYFQDRFKQAGRKTQGASLEDLYTTVIAGNPGANRNARDSFGTSAKSGTRRILKEHRPKVLQNFFGGQDAGLRDDLFSKYGLDDSLDVGTDDLFARYGLTDIPITQPSPTFPGQPMAAPIAADIAPPHARDLLPPVGQPVVPPPMLTTPIPTLDTAETVPATPVDPYQQWLAENELQDDQYSKEGFAAEQAARAQEGRITYEQPIAPNNRTIPQVQKVADEPIYATVEFVKGDKRSPRIAALDDAAHKLASQIGVDYQIVRNRLEHGNFAEGELTESQAREKRDSREEFRIGLDSNSIAELKAQQSELFKKRTSADNAFEAGKATIPADLSAADRDFEEFRLRMEADKSAGLIKPEDADKAVTKLKEDIDAWREDRGLLGIWNEEEYAKIKAGLGAVAKAGMEGKSPYMDARKDPKAGPNSKQIFDKAYTDVKKQYGSVSEYVRQQREFRERYKDSPNLVIGRSLESAAGGAAKALPQGIASVLETIAIGAETWDRAVGNENPEAEKKATYKLGQDLRKLTDEFVKINPDFKGGKAELFGNVLGQVGVQIGLGIASGGALSPTVFGATQGAAGQYSEAKNASPWQRLGAAGSGAVLAASDYIIFRNWFKGASTADQTGFLSRFTNKVRDGLVSKGIIRDEAQRVASQITDGFIDRLAKETGIKGFTGKALQVGRTKGKEGLKEAGQEGILEAKGNDLYAYLTYDPTPERLETLTTLTADNITEGVAGFFGGIAGASVAEITARASNLSDEGIAQAAEIAASLSPELSKNIKEALDEARGDVVDQDVLTKPKNIDISAERDDINIPNETKTEVPKIEPPVVEAALATDQLAESTPSAQVTDNTAGETVTPASQITEVEPKESKGFDIVASETKPVTVEGKLKQQRDEARRASEIDAPTGLGNKAAFGRALPTAEADANKSIITLDINGLKGANDQHPDGHKAGDKFIKQAADALTQAQGESGQNFRTGGDELSAININDLAPEVIKKAEKIFGVHTFKGKDGKDYQVSLTGTFGNTFKEADAQLTEAKKTAKIARAKESGIVATDREGKPLTKAVGSTYVRGGGLGDLASLRTPPKTESRAEFITRQVGSMDWYVAPRPLKKYEGTDKVNISHKRYKELVVEYDESKALKSVSPEPTSKTSEFKKWLGDSKAVGLGKTAEERGINIHNGGHLLDQLPSLSNVADVTPINSERFGKEIKFDKRDLFLQTTGGKLRSDYWLKQVKKGGRPPILVGVEDGQLRVLDGNHKATAYQEAGLSQIPTIFTADAQAKLKPTIGTSGAFDPKNRSILKKASDYRPTFEQAQTLGTKELISGLADDGITIHEPGVIEIDANHAEFIRRIIEEQKGKGYESPFDGALLRPAAITQIRRGIKTALENYGDLLTDAEKASIGKIEKVLRDNQLKKTAIIYTFDDAVPWEKFRRETYLSGGTDAQAKSVIKDSEFWKFAQNGTFQQDYGNLNEQDKIDTVMVALAEGRFERYGFDKVEGFEAKAAELLVEWANGVLRKSPDINLDEYERIQHYIKIGNDRNAARKDSEGNIGDSESRRVGRTSESPDAKDDPGKQEEKQRSLPGTLREAGLAADDELYTVFGNKEALAQANKIIDDLGIDGAIKVLENATTYDKTQAVLSTMMNRVLMNEFAKTSDERYRVKALELASKHARLATEAGQFTQAAAMTAQSADGVIYHAQQIALKKKKKLSQAAYSEIEEKAIRSEQALNDWERIKNEVRDLKAQLTRLKNKKARTAPVYNARAIDRAKSTLPDLSELIKRIKAETMLKMVAWHGDSGTAVLKSVSPETPDIVKYGAALIIDKPLSGISRDSFAKDIQKIFGKKLDDEMPKIFAEAFNLRQDLLTQAKKDIEFDRVKQESPNKPDAEIRAIIADRETKRTERRVSGTIAKTLAKIYAPTEAKQTEDLIQIVRDLEEDSSVGDYAEKILTKEVSPAMNRGDRNIYLAAQKLIKNAKIEAQRIKDEIRQNILKGEENLRNLEREEFFGRKALMLEATEVGRMFRRMEEGAPKYYFKEGLKILGESRSILASGDLSAALRQGFYFTVTSPITMFKGTADLGGAFSGMVKSISQNKHADLVKQIEKHPNFDTMLKMGIEFADAGTSFSSLTGAEENIRTEYAKRIPGLKWWMEVSERTYSGFLDMQRALMAEAVIEEYESQGLTYKNAPEEYEAMGQLINIASGRGNITNNRKINELVSTVGRPFFAPRYAVSRFQLLAHVSGGLATMPPAARSLAAKRALRFHTAISVPLLALVAAGIVAIDPDDDDFLKIRVGPKARYEFTGGLQSYLRYLAQMGKSVVNYAMGNTKEQDMKNRLYYSNRTFWKNKLAPLPSYGAAWYTGKEPDMTEFNWLSGIYKRLVPISLGEIGGAAKDDGVKGALMVAPSLLGIGVGYYPDRVKDLKKAIKEAEVGGDFKELARLKSELEKQEKVEAEQKQKDRLKSSANKAEKAIDSEMSISEMANSGEFKRWSTDDWVTYIKESELDETELKEAKQVLHKKALNAQKSKSLTLEEVRRIKEVMPEFKLAPRVRK